MTTVLTSESDIFGSSGVFAGLPSTEEERRREVIIRLDNLQKTYLLGVEGVPALRGVSLEIAAGEFVCIFGTSGGGKTTLLNILGTIDKPTKGSLEICGQRITANTEDAVTAGLRLRNIGFVFQSFNLISSLSALENVEMPMILAGVLSGAERRERAVQLLERVGMGERVEHLPTQLSGGEQQRVTIARALANSPDILLLDEPTGDLDTVNSAIVLDLLLDLNRRDGITLVMVTHDVGLKWFSERVIWMRDGKIKTVEIVSLEKRTQAKQQLQQDLERIKQQRASYSASSPRGDADLFDESPTFVPSFANTVVRRPDSYSTHVALEPVAPFVSSKPASHSPYPHSHSRSHVVPVGSDLQRDPIEQIQIVTEDHDEDDLDSESGPQFY